MKIKVNDTIRYRKPYMRGKALRKGVVESIEILNQSNVGINGTVVSKCDTEEAREGLVNLTDGSWCYFAEIYDVVY